MFKEYSDANLLGVYKLEWLDEPEILSAGVQDITMSSSHGIKKRAVGNGFCVWSLQVSAVQEQYKPWKLFDSLAILFWLFCSPTENCTLQARTSQHYESTTP